MKKLFEVGIENTIYVMAKDCKEAESLARRSFNQEDPYNFEYGASEVLPSTYGIDFNWKDSVPYESDDNKTCGEIFKEMQEAEELRKIRAEADKKQLKFEFYEGTLTV